MVKLNTTRTPITSADLLNDRVLPFFEDHQLPLLRILTDRVTEYCGRAENHDFQFYLAINDIEHTKTKARSPQTNGICERFHKTILQEFYQVTNSSRTLMSGFSTITMKGCIREKCAVGELLWKPLWMERQYGRIKT